MEFSDPGPPLSSQEIDRCESILGLRFPKDLRNCYLQADGGVPVLCIFRDTSVSEFLPLVQEGSAIDTYRLLVADRHLAPPGFFPFAVDGGGDYFFVDTETESGKVYYYDSSALQHQNLVDLEMTFKEFLDSLEADEEE